MRKYISVNEARELLLSLPINTYTETVTLADALDRVAAIDYFATIPYPPFKRSPFDGYALRGDDTAAATAEQPAILRINQEIPCGFAPTADVPPGYAAKILTGAPIPEGADVVIKYEDTEFTDTELRVFSPQRPQSNVIEAGEDFQAGRLLVPRGTPITPAALGILASQGIAEVLVYRKPVLSIINTGTELIPPGRALAPAQIYNSSMYTLQGYVKDMGAGFLDGGIAKDGPGEINAAIDAVFARSDMIITTGGASVGDYDFAVLSAQQAGGDILFWKADIKPGGTILAYMLKGKLVLALSGNPGAAALGLLYIALPYVRKLCGRADIFPESCNLRLKNNMKKTSPKTRVMRGYLSIEEGTAYFVENDSQGSGDISSFARCDLLAEIPAGSPALTAGSMVKAYRI